MGFDLGDTIIFQASVQGLGTLSLAFRDHHYILLRNGRPLEGYRWSENESDKAVQAFRRFMTTEFARANGDHVATPQRTD